MSFIICKKLSLGSSGKEFTWEDFFSAFKSAWLRDDLFITMEESNVCITVWCNHDNRQLSYNLELHPPQKDDVDASGIELNKLGF